MAGCGAGKSGRYAVQGSVTYDGRPVENGTILLIPVDDAQGKGVKAHAEIKDGHYAFDSDTGPASGKYKVLISWKKKTGRQIPSSDPPNTIEETIEMIPAVYNSQTTLTRDISGEGKLDFPLAKSNDNGGKTAPRK
jgi:hypothetical protein